MKPKRYKLDIEVRGDDFPLTVSPIVKEAEFGAWVTWGEYYELEDENKRLRDEMDSWFREKMERIEELEETKQELLDAIEAAEKCIVSIASESWATERVSPKLRGLMHKYRSE